jgi:DMSO/TMAO reductase YedYZ molybdopterin-dependent catalytic subunit
MIQARRVLFILLCFCLPVAARTKPAAAAPVAPPEVLLTVGGEVAKPLKLTAADLAKLPRRTVRAKGHDEAESEFEGVELREVLQLAGVEFGTHLKGKSLALYVLVEATDKYRVIFALPELDPAFTDRVIIIADRQNGKPMDAAHGPLRIIAPDEKRPARWIRKVVSLTVQRAP